MQVAKVFKIKHMIKLHGTFDKILTFRLPEFVKHFQSSITIMELQKNLRAAKANYFNAFYWLQISTYIVRLSLKL